VIPAGAESRGELPAGTPYCQYELLQAHPEETHLSLYRGINRIDEHEILETLGGGRYRVLFNNLNSFTSSRERADEFGDYILIAEVPLPKVFFSSIGCCRGC
jgi:NAD+--dinitrogen-reductase ADP-D-ribosyltransferase